MKTTNNKIIIGLAMILGMGMLSSCGTMNSMGIGGRHLCPAYGKKANESKEIMHVSTKVNEAKVNG